MSVILATTCSCTWTFSISKSTAEVCLGTLVWSIWMVRGAQTKEKIYRDSCTQLRETNSTVDTSSEEESGKEDSSETKPPSLPQKQTRSRQVITNETTFTLQPLLSSSKPESKLILSQSTYHTGPTLPPLTKLVITHLSPSSPKNK